MKAFSEIELKRESLEHNIRFIRSEIGPDTEFVSVVKGNAYGHGIETFVPMLSQFGVKSFAVFNSSEAYRLLETKIPYSRLMIMGAIREDDLPWIIEHNVECFIFSMPRLMKGIEEAKRQGKQFRVHLEIETGMHRTGIDEKDWAVFADLITTNASYLSIEGICTHLAGAEEISNYVRIQKQLVTFERAKEFFTSQGIHYNHAHIACSAGVINYPETIGSLVRVGILQYGFWPSKEAKMA